MTKEVDFTPALVYTCCPMCQLKDEDSGQILIPKILSEEVNQELKEVNGKIIGYGDPCKTCQQHIDDDFKCFVEYDEKQSTPEMLEAKLPFRTGRVIWVKSEALTPKALERFDNKPMAYMESVLFSTLFKDTIEEDQSDAN